MALASLNWNPVNSYQPGGDQFEAIVAVGNDDYVVITADRLLVQRLKPQ